MKKKLSLLALSLLSVVVLRAQERGSWTLGPRMNIYTNTGDRAMVGLGAFARYSPTDHLRIEPSVVALVSSGASIDASCELHYLFRIAERWSLYPLLGVSVNEMEENWAVGMPLGGGCDFRVASRWDLNAAVKWMPIFDSDRRNPVVISLGGCYRF